MKLMPFQKEGVHQIESFNGRAILADEMGLGKTIQALAWVKQHDDAFPVAVACPAYLKENWAREIEKWLGVRTVVLSGRKSHAIRKAKIYVVNYDVLQPVKFQKERKRVHNKQTWTAFLKKAGIQTIIADEAHYIKNRSALRSKAIKQLSIGVPHVLLLTGTPMENKPAELWFLLHICVPGLFPSFYNYGQRYCDPQLNWFTGGVKYDGASDTKHLHKKLRKHVLIRRLKKEIGRAHV